MTNKLRQITAAIATIGLISCGGGGEDPAPDTVVATVSLAGSTNIAPAGTSQLTATGRNAAGIAIAGSGATATWQSSATSVATVSSTGLVSALANGSSTITATISGKSGTRLITVAAVVISPSASITADGSNSFTPSPVDISLGGTVTWNFSGLNAHNVTFAGTSGAPANIPDTQNASVTRTFSTAGSFSYNCTIHAGMTGTVVVH